LEGVVKLFETVTNYPESPEEQLTVATEAMLNNYNSFDSAAYRASHGIPDSGTAVIVQSMIYGNLTSLSSGTGQAYSRCPNTGNDVITGLYRSRSEGEDSVVAGTRDMEMNQFKVMCPDAYTQLFDGIKNLERDVKDMIRVDFTVENGSVFFLQVYKGRRSGEAAIKIACDMVTTDTSDIDVNAISSQGVQVRKKGPVSYHPNSNMGVPHSKMIHSSGFNPTNQLISKTDALLRIPVDQITDGLDPVWYNNDYCSKIISWADEVRDISVMANVSNVEDSRNASFLFSDGVGLLKIEDLINCQVNHDAMSSFASAVTPEQRVIALEKLKNNLLTQFTECLKVAPGVVKAAESSVKQKLQYQQQPQDALDFTSAVVDPITYSKITVNALLYDNYTARAFVLLPEFLQIQVEACIGAALQVQQDMSIKFEINVVVPCLVSDHELDYILPYVHDVIVRTNETFQTQQLAKEFAKEEAESKNQRSGIDISHAIAPFMSTSGMFSSSNNTICCNVGIMISTPRACIRSNAIAKVPAVQFLCFDLTSLTEKVFGFTEDEAANFMEPFIQKHILAANPFKSLDRNGVGSMIKSAITLARDEKPGMMMMGCGTACTDGKSIRFLADAGINVVTVDVKSIPLVKITAAQSSIEAKIARDTKNRWAFTDVFNALDIPTFDDIDYSNMMELTT
jgi:phosphoenolpyruvate synthase/pyruvate phosphate dikinase